MHQIITKDISQLSLDNTNLWNFSFFSFLSFRRKMVYNQLRKSQIHEIEQERISKLNKRKLYFSFFFSLTLLFIQSIIFFFMNDLSLWVMMAV